MGSAPSKAARKLPREKPWPASSPAAASIEPIRLRPERPLAFESKNEGEQTWSRICAVHYPGVTLHSDSDREGCQGPALDGKTEPTGPGASRSPHADSPSRKPGEVCWGVEAQGCFRRVTYRTCITPGCGRRQRPQALRRTVSWLHL
jgi:hypothetical protein